MKTRIAISTLIILGAFAVVFGQNKDRNTGFSPDKSLKSNARVNPSTLAMELSVPIGAYPQRGGGSLPISFDYSSKVWELKAIHPNWLTNLGARITDAQAIFAQRTAAGWTSSLTSPRIDYTWEVYNGYDSGGLDTEGQIYDSIDPMPSPNPDTDGLFYVKRLHVQMPDGSTHEFRSGDDRISCGTTSGGGCTSTDFTGTYYSVDGSKMRLEAGDSSSTLYLPDGSRYLFGTKTTADPGHLAYAYIDRNGNQMTYTTTTSPTTHYWTDTMGRTIYDPMPLNWIGSQHQTTGTPSQSYPGFDSDTIAVGFTWRYLKDPGSGESGLTDTSQSLRYYTNWWCYGNTSSDISSSPHLFDTSFPVRGCNQGTSNPGDQFNPIVLTKITLNNGQTYQFKYNIYGEIEKIIYPTGGYERFVYAQIVPTERTQLSYDQLNRGVTDRYISPSGSGSDEIHWTYSVDAPIASPYTYTITTTAPNGTISEQMLYAENSTKPQHYGYHDSYLSGRPYEERMRSSASGNPVMLRHLISYEVTSNSVGYTGGQTAIRDIRPVKDVTILFEPGNSYALATMTETVYDTADSVGSTDLGYFSSLNPKYVKKYDYVTVSASTASSANISTAAGWFSTPAVITENTYLYDSNYKTRNITGLVTETKTEDGSGNPKSKTQISYDDTSHTESSTGTMPSAASGSWIDPDDNGQWGSTVGPKRGNPTIVKHYYDISNSYYIQTESFYDQFGNLRKARDGRGNDSTTVYDDDYAFAFPTSITTPIPDSAGTYGSNAVLTTTGEFDYNTGLPTMVKDPNNLEARIEYDDDLLRVTKVYNHSGSNDVGGSIETSYGAGTSDSTRWVRVRSQIDGTGWKESYTFADGLGRKTVTQSIDAADHVYTVICYDSMGRVSKSSNPVRSSSAPTCSSSLDWTTTAFDTAGRLSTVTTPDSAVVTTTYGLASTSSYLLGSVTTVTDQAGKLRRSVTNALGQLKRVDEPDNSSTIGALGSLTSSNQPTTYDYDTLNNLVGIQQDGTSGQCGTGSSCSQSRSFTYDALSRLQEATNPESGTIDYTYDANNNLATKTDARGIVTTYTYDRLNRVTQRAYTAPSPTPANYQTTPDVTYYYDNVTNAKGKLTKVSNSVSTTEYTSFDILGRVTGAKQTTDGGDSSGYTTSYTYRLDGSLDEETYPSTRVVKNVLDANGDLAMVESKKTSSTGYWNYAKSFTYNAAGAVTSMQLGNGHWESTSFNNRLQPEQIYLGTVQGDNDLLKLNYTYNTSGNHDNNGNVLTHSITVKRVGQSDLVFDQSYTYDSLNRLHTAEEKTGSTTNWKQTFIFDRYGNRNFDEGNTTTLPKNCGTSPNYAVCTADVPMVNPAVNTSNNRLTGYSFDAAGNVIVDADSRSFTYDAENKQTEVKNSSSTTVGTYFFDGDGRRVKKVEPSTGEITIFVYDASGKQIAEYSTNVVSAEDARVQYLTLDHLETPRINTDAYGTISARHDYMPYGEEIITLGGRSSDDKYVGDDVRQGFTGYENDDETGLDYAQARMFAKGIGRFNSVDPLMASADIVNPQTFNRYAYVGNNPVNITDPTGELWGLLDGKISWYADAAALQAAHATEVFLGQDAAGQLYALNPNSTIPVAVPNWQAGIAKLVDWTVKAASIATTGEMLGVGAGAAVAVAMLYLSTYAAPDSFDASRPEPVRGLKMGVYEERYWMDLAAQMNKVKESNPAASSSSQSTPADPNSVKPGPEENKPSKARPSNSINSVDDALKAATDFSRKKGGTRQGWISGTDAKTVFRSIAKENNIQLKRGQTGFKDANGSFVGIHKSIQRGLTIDINRGGQRYKIGFKP